MNGLVKYTRDLWDLVKYILLHCSMSMTQFTELSKIAASSATRVINLTPTTLSVSYPTEAAKTTFLRGQIPTGSKRRQTRERRPFRFPSSAVALSGADVFRCVCSGFGFPLPFYRVGVGREKTKRESTERGSEGRQTPCRILEFHPQQGEAITFGVSNVIGNQW